MKPIIAAVSGLLCGVVVASGPAATAEAPTPPATGRAEMCVLDAASGCTKAHGFGTRPSSVTANAAGVAIVSVNPAQTTTTSYRLQFTRPNGSKFAAGTPVAYYVHYDFRASSGPAPTPTATPTATPTQTPNVTATATSPTRNCTDPVFTTSQSNAGWSTNGYYVHNNMWNNSGGTQTLRACAYNNWNVTATQPNTTSVKTYPNVHKDYDDKPISSFNRLTSTFAANTPHVGIYNVAYDIWLNGIATSGSTEVMIWTENFKQRPAGSVQATVTFGGQTYDVWRSGEHYIAFVSRTTQTSGTMNLLEMFRWLQSKGWISQSTTVGQIDYGVEVCSTNNAPATFNFTDFSITEG